MHYFYIHYYNTEVRVFFNGIERQHIPTDMTNYFLFFVLSAAILHDEKYPENLKK